MIALLIISGFVIDNQAMDNSFRGKGGIVFLGTSRAIDLNPVDTVLAMAGMVNYYFLSTLATQELINHSPERDEVLIRHYMDIFTKGILSH
jgi:hypothetical protein